MGGVNEGAVVGLRVDVDTFRGTRDGVPNLLSLFADRGICASFFFSVGPDNMGRHLWRLVEPAFLYKMLRSSALNLYGWDILRRGVFWPGIEIGSTLAAIIRRTEIAGHELGLHAWDHHAWQVRLHKMSQAELEEHLRLGFLSLQRILGAMPGCTAAAGWICNDAALKVKQRYRVRYNSDCRGDSVFRPVVDGRPLSPQVPVTMPTYDEAIGKNGIDDRNYNEYLMKHVRPSKLNVLTIHAEVEGIARYTLFREFLELAEWRKICFVPLGELLPALDEVPLGKITQGRIEGRSGRLCVQVPA